MEDEILKTAVAKYGLTQWARISSLLARKTAKQCKARWDEWINPRIKKTIFSPQEDEKLLHLAKVMPNQWRSIAMILGNGRTASQCVERFQALLMSANGSSSTELANAGPGAEALAAGDLNLNPESKPARPDAVDMDEDEREMLSEARARLANTQGKKAKRKARERMLDESKRIAMIQKRRELKQAGVNAELRKKLKKTVTTSMDYNADITFQRTPQAVLYDDSKESQQNVEEKVKFQKDTARFGTSNQEYEKGKIKEKRLKAQEERQKRRQESDTSNVIQQSAKMFHDLTSVKKRKLNLPAPGEVVRTEFEGGADERISQAVSSIQNEPSRNFLLGPNAVIDDDDMGESDYLDDERKPFKVSSLASKFASLPKAENEFEIVMDESRPEEEPPTEALQILVDEGEVERLKEKEQAILDQQKLLMRSLVVQRDLPIPDKAPGRLSSSDVIQALCDHEMILLIEADRQGSVREIDFEALQLVRQQIAVEAGSIPVSSVAWSLPADQIPAAIDHLKEMSRTANNIEAKLNAKSFAGYRNVNEKLVSEREQLVSDLQNVEMEIRSLSAVVGYESMAIESRRTALQSDVNLLVNAEQRGQRKYSELTGGI